MSDQPPIPSVMWQRILAFLRAGLTGSITLNVHGGKVQDVSITERVRDTGNPAA